MTTADRRSLVRLSDCVSRCTCTASVFHDPGNPGLRCRHCGKVPARPPLFQLPDGKVVLCEGAAIRSHHLREDWNYDTVVGVVEAHPGKPGEVVLRNVSSGDSTMTPDGEAEIKVAPQRRLGVRPMVIDFGSVQGRIRIG